MTPLEKAARALADRRPELKLGGYPDAMLRNTSLWGDAIAVLQALRDPDEGMIEAMIAAWHERPAQLLDDDCSDTWRAGIDHILNTHQSTKEK